MKTTITASDTEHLLKSIREDLNVHILEPGENPRMYTAICCCQCLKYYFTNNSNIQLIETLTLFMRSFLFVFCIYFLALPFTPCGFSRQ